MKISYQLLFLAILGVSGCMTKKKAVEYVRATPNVSAPLCAELYPVKNIFIPGENKVIIDTVTVTDTLSTTITTVINDTVVITKNIPVTQTITRTITKTDTIVKVDSAAMVAARQESEKIVQDYTAVLKENIYQRKTIGRLTKILVAIVIIVGGGVVLKIKKLI